MFDKKSYMKEYHKKDYKKNRKIIDKKNVEYYHTHKEEILEYKKKHYRNNKDASRESSYKRIYGIGLAEYNSMMEKQNHRCKICGTSQELVKRYFNIDHNHTTKRIRGLLCSNCNQGLGMFRDNISTMEKALHYLRLEGNV